VKTTQAYKARVYQLVVGRDQTTKMEYYLLQKSFEQCYLNRCTTTTTKKL